MTFWKKWVWNSNRVYMIPTRFGAACGFLFLFFTITAAHYTNNLIFLFAFILVSFLIVAILQTAKNLRGLKIHTVSIQPGFPGEISYAQISIENSKKQTKMGMGVQFHKQKDFALIDEIAVHDKIWIQVPLVLPNKRGFFTTQRIKIFTDAPYGLFYGWHYFYRNDQGLVYPHPQGLLADQNHGNASGSDFSGLKKYQEGDSLARISWKHSAKKDELLLKEFSDEIPQTEIYDLSACPQKDIEEKLSQLCLWVVDAERKNKTYALVLNNEQPLFGNGETHFKKCLSDLGAY